MRAFISSIGAFKSPGYRDETADIESGSEYSDGEPEIIVDRLGRSDNRPRWKLENWSTVVNSPFGAPVEPEPAVQDHLDVLPSDRGRVGVAALLSSNNSEWRFHGDAGETPPITRRETDSERAAGLGEIRSILDGLHDGDEHQLPSQPARLPQNLEHGRPTRPSQRSWAAIASRGNAGRERVDLTTPPRPSRWGSLAGDENFQVKVPEGW